MFSIYYSFVKTKIKDKLDAASAAAVRVLEGPFFNTPTKEEWEHILPTNYSEAQAQPVWDWGVMGAESHRHD